MTRNFLPKEVLNYLFRYDPETGVLYWRVHYAKQRAGDRAGSLQWKNKKGDPRWIVKFGGRAYACHILIWIIMRGAPPKNEIDHKNRDRTDNRWENLREATRSQNQSNTQLYRSNKSGFRGVSFDRTTGRYKAFISQDGKNKNLGSFDSAAEAHEVWMREAKLVHGEFLSA